MNLSELKDTHKGERCFILGNGPSLNKTRLSELKDEFTIGLNRIYLKFPEMGFSTDIVCCVNELVLKQFGSEIVEQKGLKFINDRARGLLPQAQDTFFMNSLAGVGFQTDLSQLGWFSGATVTFCALQVAYHLGFDEVVLLGVDHNFVQSGRAHLASVSKGPDVNHFDPNYFGKNVVWQYPDLVESELNYAIAGEAFRLKGGKVLDATVGGKLTVFEKVSGYAIDPADDVRSPETDIQSHGNGSLISPRQKMYEVFVTSRHMKPIKLVGAALCAAGLIWLIYRLAAEPILVQPLVAIFIMLVGAALFIAASGAGWISEWSRVRRLKDGQSLLQILRMMK